MLMKAVASLWPMIGCRIAVDRHVALVVVDRLVDVELDAAVVADQRGHLERDADVLVGDGGGGREELLVPTEAERDAGRPGDDGLLLGHGERRPACCGWS